MAEKTRMWALDAPLLSFDTAIIHDGAKSEIITIPCPSYLIEHPRGLVLFDAGPDPAAVGDAASVYGSLMDNLTLHFSEDQRLDRQLAALGFDVDDVDVVIISHAHFDHIGGVRHFPRARIVIGKGEIPWALWPNPRQRGSFFRADIDAVPLENWREIVGDYDVYGDGVLTALSTPGHTPGQLSLLVRLESRTFILTGDAAHDQEQITRQRALPGDAHGPHAVDSLRRLQQLGESLGADIWVGHDVDDWRKYKHAPEYYE